jgi:hypothetical protein
VEASGLRLWRSATGLHCCTCWAEIEDSGSNAARAAAPPCWQMQLVSVSVICSRPAPAEAEPPMDADDPPLGSSACRLVRSSSAGANPDASLNAVLSAAAVFASLLACKRRWRGRHKQRVRQRQEGVGVQDKARQRLPFCRVVNNEWRPATHPQIVAVELQCMQSQRSSSSTRRSAASAAARTPQQNGCSHINVGSSRMQQRRKQASQSPPSARQRAGNASQPWRCMRHCTCPFTQCWCC